jgi:putative gluconate periplasmic binding protein with phosphoribosyltransferase domain, GNT I system
LEERTFLDGLLIGFAYKSFLKKLILKLKFYHKKDIALFLAERGALLIQLNPYLSSSLEKHQLFLSFVPSHRYRRYFQKGYNQSELLATSVSNLLQLPFLSCFKKSRATVSQVKLNRAERLKNLSSAFEFIDGDELPLGGTLLIVDDVTTT